LNWCKFLTRALSSLLSGRLYYRYIFTALKIINSGCLDISELKAMKRQTHSLNEFPSPEPAVGVPATTVHTEAQLWATKERLKSWKTIPFCRQAKMLLHGLNRQFSRSVLKLNRRNIKVLVGLLTDHSTLNRQTLECNETTE